MLDPRKLRLLRELSRLGTIAAVAQSANFTPSAVSQQLSALEREAGTTLLERTGRTVALTPAGWVLVEHAHAVLEELERAAAALAAIGGEPSGPLRIGAFPSATRALLPKALAELARAHPGLTPMVSEIDPADVTAALRAGELDVALVHEYDFVPPVVDLGISTEPLFEEAMFLTNRASIRAARRDPWILATPGTLCHTMAIRACQAAGFEPRVRHHVDDFDTVLAFAAAGQGVALVPGLAAAAPPDGVRLTPLPLRRRTLVAFRSGYGGHPAVCAAVAALRATRPEGALSVSQGWHSTADAD
jgi:DNA-binding transcriptional LysR family regulator